MICVGFICKSQNVYKSLTDQLLIRNMEEDKRNKITRLLPKLIKCIDCNITLIAHQQAAKTIGHEDYEHLATLTNKLDRSYALLNILYTRKDGYKFLVDGLSETNQTGALEILGEPIHDVSTHHESAGLTNIQLAQMQITAGYPIDSEISSFHQVPFHSEEATQLFTGRRREFNILLDSLMPDGGTASITGIGGIGKTELAKMFLQKLDEDAYKNVFKQIIWINCESAFSATTNFTTIAKDYLKIPAFNSSGQEREMSSILNDVYEKLAKSKSLIILDNVETKEILLTYYRKTSKKSKLSILVTSQIIKLGTHIPLDSLDLPEAVKFVKKGLSISEPLSNELENGILELVKRLEMLPLAIIQAIGYIKEKREMYVDFGSRDYLDNLDRIPIRIFDSKSFSDLLSNGKTIYKTLDLSLSRIEAFETTGMLASKILSKVAFMAPDNIPSSLFSELAENDNDAIEEALILIRRFSIIKYKPVDKNNIVQFSIHRLVQDVLRIRIDLTKQTEISIHSTMELLNCHLNYELTEHALATWKHASRIQNLVELFCDIPHSITVQMNNNGRTSDAYNFSASSLILLKQKLNIKKHSSAIFWLQGYNNYILSFKGKPDNSLEKLEATLDEAKKFLPDGDDVIFKTQFYIAYIYYVNGQSDKAAFICDKMCKDYNFYNLVSLSTLLDIGQLQNALKRFQDAQKTTKYILKHLYLISEQNREELEFDTKCLMAHIIGRVGNYLESIALYSEILQTFMTDRKNIISNSDRWLLFHNMGTNQYCAGLFEEAHDSYQKALNEMSGQKESDCATILKTKSNIAGLMLARNMIDEALPFSIEVYEQIKQFYGEKNYWILDSLGNVGLAYSKAGRHHDAVEILTQVIEDKNYVHHCVDEAKLLKYYLALSLEQIGRLERSVEILSELKLQSFQNPNYKLCTIKQVDSALNRIHETQKRLYFRQCIKLATFVFSLIIILISVI